MTNSTFSASSLQPSPVPGKSANASGSAQPPLAPAAPPSPKIQAIGFALELAKTRATGGNPGQRVTDVSLLISDAEAIAKFIGPNDVQTSLTLRG